MIRWPAWLRSEPTVLSSTVVVGTGGMLPSTASRTVRFRPLRPFVGASLALLIAAVFGITVWPHISHRISFAPTDSYKEAASQAAPKTPTGNQTTPQIGSSGAVQVWQTSADYHDALTQQPSLDFASGSANGTAITIDSAKRYQQIEGFGASLTDTAAYVLSRSSHRDDIMQKLFDPDQGIGISWLRQPIGASDFAVNAYYTYDDTAGDTGLSHFSIDHDQAYILPLLKQALQLNPGIKVIGTPWTPPAWMKTNNSFVNLSGQRGTLNSADYSAYAHYFVKYLQAYQAAGVPIYGVTIQNEPNQPTDYPGMDWSGSNQATFVKNNLLPALRDAKIHPLLMTYDYGYLSSSFTSYISAYQPLSSIINTAYHCYQGTNFPSLTASLGGNYLTECSTSISPTYSSKSSQPLQPADLIMDTMRAGAKTATYWNAAEDQNNGPRYQNQGCGDQKSTNGSPCTPLVTINTNNDSVTYNAEYYTLGQFSKFVMPGANRIDSTDTSSKGLKNVAFVNPDGSKVVVMHNLNSSASTLTLQWRGQTLSYSVPAGAVVTFTWADPPTPLPTQLQSLSKEYYFAEGSTMPNYNTYFTLLNTGGQPATVTCSYLTEGSGVITRTYVVQPNRPTTIYANDDLPSGQLFGTHLTSDQPILAERTINFYYAGLKAPGASNVVGATAPQTQWYFAEGYTGTGFNEYLSIVNPTDTAENATVQYYYSDGTSKQITIPLAPYQHVQRNVNSDINAGRNVSALVTSDGGGIIAERLMYFQFANANQSGSGPKTINSGNASFGLAQLRTTSYFAEGYTGANFNEYLTLFNPSATASSATITYYVSGQSPVTKTQSLPAHSRQTVNVNSSLGNGKQFSMRVISGIPIAAERLIYFAYGNSNGRGATNSTLITGGSVSSGVSAPSTLQLFADGTTRYDNNEFLTVQNTNTAAAQVTITYFESGGGQATYQTTIPAQTRSNIWVFRTGSGGIGTQVDSSGVSALVSADQPIVVEKVMYTIGPNLNQSGAAPFNLLGGYSTAPTMLP